jgi:hypothetical protein
MRVSSKHLWMGVPSKHLWMGVSSEYMWMGVSSVKTPVDGSFIRTPVDESFISQFIMHMIVWTFFQSPQLSVYNTAVSLIRPHPAKAIPLVKSDFRCIMIVN